MSISSETRKRLWGRSGNRCAKCRQEIVRPDAGDVRGALVGEEAHIVARSPGGPRYEPLDLSVRDGYDNLILLCANDHAEIDAQSNRYPVDALRLMKRRHESWVKGRLDGGLDAVSNDGVLATVMGSGDQLWELLDEVLGWQVGMPHGLTDDQEDFIDQVMQTITDWGEISTDVRAQGFRSMREAKRSLQELLGDLAGAGFLLLAGCRRGTFGGGAVSGPVAVLEVVRPEDLEALRASPGVRHEDGPEGADQPQA